MEIKKETLSYISECYSENLHIEKSNLCCTVNSSTMENSVFTGVNLSGSKFSQGELKGAKLEQMGLRNCTFKNSSMPRPEFVNVGMSGARFTATDMERADFERVGLRNAIITNSDLTGVTVRNCKTDGMTINGYNVDELIEFYKNNHKGE